MMHGQRNIKFYQYQYQYLYQYIYINTHQQQNKTSSILVLLESCLQTWYVNKYLCYIGKTYRIFWNIFIVLTFIIYHIIFIYNIFLKFLTTLYTHTHKHTHTRISYTFVKFQYDINHC